MDFFNRDDMKSYRSGRLGERFCKEHFGISEPHYEIKCSSNRASGVVIQAWQLLEQLTKQYVIVRYRREMKTISRGPNKGRRRHTETIEQGFQNHEVLVYVIRGERLIRMVLSNKLPIYSTARGGDVMKYGKWGIVWRIPIKHILEECDHVFAKNETWLLFGDADDPPSWLGEEVAASQGGLFAKPKEKKEEDEKDPVPF